MSRLSGAAIRPKRSSSCPSDGSSSGPWPGSDDAAGLPRIGSASIARRSPSSSSPQSALCCELVEPSILGLLLADVLPDHRFVSNDGRDEVSPGPEMLPYEVALSFAVDTGQVDCAPLSGVQQTSKPRDL